jgi:hypothetical protein
MEDQVEEDLEDQMVLLQDKQVQLIQEVEVEELLINQLVELEDQEDQVLLL